MYDEWWYTEYMKILIVEDNEVLAKYTKQMLEEAGYVVDVRFDGESGELLARTGAYDLLVLDIMLPNKDGISVCQDLRRDSYILPIIMITAKGEVDDRVLGLDSGADDYLVKPFDMKELLARTRTLLRRPSENLAEQLSVQDLVLDTKRHLVLKGGEPIALTTKEYQVLEYFMRNVDSVISREQLLEHCWDFAYTAFSNITDAYIKQLRKKLTDTDETYIQTIRGAGYKLKSKE